TANPKQSYGINWAGVVGSSTNAKTVSYGAPANASVSSTGSSSTSTNGTIPTSDFVLGSAGNHNIFGNLSQLALGQFAILSVPQMSATLRFLNEDADAEFLAKIGRAHV